MNILILLYIYIYINARVGIFSKKLQAHTAFDYKHKYKSIPKHKKNITIL